MTVDIFANLDALRLSPDDASSMGANRSHPDPDMTLSTAVFEDKTEDEIYLVHPDGLVAERE
jgi:hypothetical protein